jgi:predicted Zn-ribbon and HTH transcriptional regulator
MFGKDGIPLIQIENAFEQLETEVNTILEALNADCRVAFSSFRELTTKEKECRVCGIEFAAGAKVCDSCGVERRNRRKDELAVRLLYGSAERSFESDSGGGMTLVSLAVRPALARLIERRQQHPCKMLLLDEVLGNLDRYNRENVTTALFKLFVEIFGFEQVFVITHTDVTTYGYAFDELRVSRVGHSSSIGWIPK